MAKLNAGLLGRSPDYINTGIMSLGVAEEIFKEENQHYHINIRQIYEDAMENDLTFTHTFINPQVNRSDNYFEESDKVIAAKVIRENK